MRQSWAKCNHDVVQQWYDTHRFKNFQPNHFLAKGLSYEEKPNWKLISKEQSLF